MNKLFKKILFSIVFTLPGCAIMAVPAKPGLILMRQPDGTELKVRIIGDERSHYYLSEDGYLLINDNDTFYYGNTDSQGHIIKSAVKAVPAAMRSAEARRYIDGVDMTKVFMALKTRDAQKTGLRTTGRSRAPLRNIGLCETGFPSRGEQKVLVILVEYKDIKFSLDNPHDYFSRMLNETGFSDYGGTGSAAEYFRESSNNQFKPQFDVYGPVTLSKNMNYYGGNDWNGDDENPHKMAIEACQQLDGTIDFSEYDRDNDGYIDNVFIFYAGRGEASGGGASTVWPHSWYVTEAETLPYIYDGVQLDRYACSNEWEGTRPDGVGTFVHEFSHVMGLPDLYATEYTSAFTPGAWSVLDSGPYNNDGCTPPLYSIYERYSLGWIEPTVLDRAQNIKLEDIGSNKGCIIHTDDPNEFFLIENRQQTGWDKYIPGHGMLVWHVDYDKNIWEQNIVNNTAKHQFVDLEEADGTQTEKSRSGDAFPGTAGITSFTDDTKPSMRTWDGTRLNLPITDITESEGIISFNVANGNHVPMPVTALEAADVTQASFTARWEPSPEAEYYELSVYIKKKTENGKTMFDYVDGYNMRNVGMAVKADIVNLVPETEYGYVVYVNKGGERSEASNEINVTTTAATGINEKKLPEGLKTEGRNLTVQSDSGISLNIVDIMGRQVFSGVVHNGIISIPTEGVYILYIGREAHKIIVK